MQQDYLIITKNKKPLIRFMSSIRDKDLEKMIKGSKSFQKKIQSNNL